MGEEGETQRVQIQALKTANSEPELSARARASRRPHSPTRHRGTAGACVGWGRGGGGLGLPGSGNHAGEVREAADGHSGTWTPGEQSCPRPAPLGSARALRLPGCLSCPLRAGGAAGGLSEAPGRGGCVRAPGAASARVLEARGARPLTALPGGLAPPAGAGTHPSALQPETLGTAHLGRPESGPARSGSGQRGPENARPARAPRPQSRLPPSRPAGGAG